tara:strand:+ start:261 stop:389 length:129 start_codon:yes stop_codon:yes gene_type:complete
MTKNILVVIFLSMLILSCGKKGDPTYQEPKSEKLSTKIKVVL